MCNGLLLSSSRYLVTEFYTFLVLCFMKTVNRTILHILISSHPWLFTCSLHIHFDMFEHEILQLLMITSSEIGDSEAFFWHIQVSTKIVSFATVWVSSATLFLLVARVPVIKRYLVMLVFGSQLAFLIIMAICSWPKINQLSEVAATAWECPSVCVRVDIQRFGNPPGQSIIPVSSPLTPR